ncbi:MAG TPA: ribonuclease III [Balneolales bacterium]|nr:ribonuclease III [Balneolales bacterium]
MIARIRAYFRKKTLNSINQDKIVFLERLFNEPIDNPSIYLKALRHRSKLADADVSFQDTDSYEQLEFLGDAVLDLIVTEILFEKFPDENEGFMTKLRSKVVKGHSLARLSRKLNLGSVVEVGSRAKGQGIEYSSSVLADIFEAVIGAYYRDKGYSKAFKFIADIIDQYVDLTNLVKTHDNYKSLLLEYAQAHKSPIPHYKVISEKGPPHNKIFEIQVSIKDKILGQGVGKNKKTAEQIAAKLALQQLQGNEK